MRVRWTIRAADDLADIVDYIRKDNPAAARRVARDQAKGFTTRNRLYRCPSFRSSE